MFQVCVCDDDSIFLNRIIDKINKISKKNNIDINVNYYSSGEAMIFNLEEFNINVDIFFLDIIMNDLSGLDVAQKLRELGYFAQIIFLTDSKDHVFKSFEVRPLYYLLKSETNEIVLEKILLKAFEVVKKCRKTLFFYKVGHSQKKISTEKIVYFEIINRIVIMHMIDLKTENFYLTMNQLENSVVNKNFIRIHRSFLVNFYNIKSFDSKFVICVDESILPIGEKYLKNLRELYSKYIFEEFEIL